MKLETKFDIGQAVVVVDRAAAYIQHFDIHCYYCDGQKQVLTHGRVEDCPVCHGKGVTHRGEYRGVTHLSDTRKVIYLKLTAEGLRVGVEGPLEVDAHMVFLTHEDARQRVDALNAMDRCNFREAFARQRGIEEESEGSAELKEDESE